MQTAINPEILAQQRYSCNQCGKGCRSFLVGLRPGEAEAIEKLQNWRASLGVEELFKKSRLVRRTGVALAKRDDGRCVFLGDDNLCEIHRRYGMGAKPFACQLYPFVLTPVAGQWRVGLRFDCPQVCRNEGKALSDYYQGIGKLSQKLVSSVGGSSVEQVVPELLRGVAINGERFEQINASLMKIVTSDALELVRRLEWLRQFTQHLRQVKWRNVTDEDFSGLLQMFEGGLLAEVSQSPLKPEPPGKRVRKLLGQIFFLLSQPAKDENEAIGGWTTRFSQRWTKAQDVKRMGDITGTLPNVRPEWPGCDLSELEESFGPWPEDVEKMVERYLLCRIGSMNYCGAGFYGYSVVEGVESLLLGVVTLGWLMRIAALKAGRKVLELADAQKAVMAIDGNMGYSQALGMSAARLRLEYLSGHLATLVPWYCL